MELFNYDIKNEFSQATNEVPFIRFLKEKEYLNPLPNIDILLSYFHHEKEYKVSKESMIRYKGKKYSVPTKYIGNYVTVSEIESELYIYYTKDLIACHKISEKLLHYQKEHAKEIPFTEALLELTEKELDFRNERASKIQTHLHQ